MGLAGAVVNAAKRQHRDDAVATEHAEASANGDSDEQRAVRAWIAVLPERQRLAVYLLYYADLDYRSIATALGVEVGTVSATLSAADENLRKSIEEVPR